MEQQLRSIARRYLPESARKPLGSLWGRLQGLIFRPFLGLVFDLKGGDFHADGCTFTIPRDATTRTDRSYFLGSDWEQEGRDLVARHVRPEDTVIELGGCLGIVSVITNKRLKDPTRHVVVEANPFCIPALYRNRQLSQAGFLIENCAVASQPELTFYLDPVSIVGGNSQRVSNRPVRLPAKSLRQLDRERGPFSVLIIDIEGGELDVFTDSQELLKNYRLVLMEFHEFAIGVEGVEKCRQILRESGHRMVEQIGTNEAWVRA